MAAAAVAREDFSEVQRAGVAELMNLFAATEAIGDDDGGGSGGADGGQQTVLRDGFRDFEFVGFKPKRTGHAAATRLDGFDDGAGALEECDFAGGSAEDGFVVAVAVDEDVRASETGGREVRRVRGEPVGEEPDLLAELLRVGIFGEDFEELVFEDAGAAGLKKDEGQAGANLRRHAGKDLREITARGVEQAEVVKRTAAADVAAWDFDAEAGFSEDLFRGGEGLRMVVVVPGVGPQHHLRWGGLRFAPIIRR